ncbi:hypothetical protein [Shewanella salipaludis]|uniref:DUF1240 domain-containing protein n=1 Tax=Shewanella salipaludis TaxID=2723052 RepID=A0A972G599_9GAMM|nr:hypothetical protein [Shewanella salipaludis]NMH64710.1 hypothetical protein [Shewanella salipaludis]
MNTSSSQDAQLRPAQGIFFIVLLLLVIAGYVYSLFSELSMLARVHEQGTLIKIRTSIPPLLVMMPALAVLIRGIACRLRRPESERAQKKGLYFIIASFPVFLLVWAVYSWQLGNWFDDNGYTECTWYSGATLGAPKIMLSDPGYCVKQGYQIRIELIDWFETQHNSGINPSLEAFTQKQQQLLADYKKRFDLL